jgi:hypothetical protein
MMTDGGAHPPETLAWSTAQRIVDDFSENAPGAVYAEVLAYRERIEQILAGHHRIAQTLERTALRTEGPARLASPIDTDQYIPDAVDDIIAAAREKDVAGRARWPSLVQYFARPQTRQYLEDVLHMEFHQTAHIERSWHAQGHQLGEDGMAVFDAHPDHAAHPAAKAFLAVVAQGPALLSLPDLAGPKDELGNPMNLSDLAEHGGRELVSAMVLNSIPKITAKAED